MARGEGEMGCRGKLAGDASTGKKGLLGDSMKKGATQPPITGQQLSSIERRRYFQRPYSPPHGSDTDRRPLIVLLHPLLRP